MNDCIEFQGRLDKDGYGYLSVAKHGQRRAHRATWCAANGPIPEGICVCHSCDNPPCINLAHLFLGTQKDNAQDMVTKGRYHVKRGKEAPNVKLSEGDILQIIALLPIKRGTGNNYGGLTHKEIGKMFGVSGGAISQIAAGKNWKHITSVVS